MSNCSETTLKTKRFLTGLINVVAVCVIASLASSGLFVGKGNDDNNNNSLGTSIVEMTPTFTASLPAEGNAPTHSVSTKMIELANGKKKNSSATPLQYAMRNPSKQSRRALKMGMGMGKGSSGTQSPTSLFIGTKSQMGKSTMGKGSKSFTDACVTVDDFASKSKGMMRSRNKMMSSRLLEDMMEPAMVSAIAPAMEPQNTDERGQSTRALGMMGMKSSSDIFVATERSSSGGKMMGKMMGKSGSGGKTGKSKGKSKSKASVPTLFCSDAPSVQPTVSQAPSVSSAPSMTPTISPSDVPSKLPSDAPSRLPSSSPSNVPSKLPSDAPSNVPSKQPSDVPSKLPSDAPSGVPSKLPSNAPSGVPSKMPSDVPSKLPSAQPSAFPSKLPSGQPSSFPSVSAAPSSPEPPMFYMLENFGRGDCRISADGQCFFSDSGDATGDYPAGGSCVVRLSRRGTIDSVRFRLSTGDFLNIAGVGSFSSLTGPSSVSVERDVDITFTADANPFTTAGGFEICIVP